MGPVGHEVGQAASLPISSDAPPARPEPADALRRLKTGALDEPPPLQLPDPIEEEPAPQTLELTYPEEVAAQPRARSRSPYRGVDAAAPGSK